MQHSDDIVVRVSSFLRSSSGRLDLDRSVGVNADTWRPWLCEWPAADQVVDALRPGGVGRRGTHRIDRDDLVSYSREAEAGTDEALTRLFVATMLWGSGTTNGRGPRYTAAALGDPNLIAVLARTAESARQGHLEQGYADFRVSGVGRSFLTKWLWAVALPCDMARPPLILDDRVIATANRLGYYFRPTAHRWAKRYEIFCDRAAEWAQEVGAGLSTRVTPEHIEMLLFARGPDSLFESLRATST